MLARRRRPGFTMVETVIVLIILGVIAAIGLPKLNVFKYKGDAAAIELRTLLMQAQRDAIVYQHDLIVMVDASRNRVIIGFDKNNDNVITSAERVRIRALPDNDRFSAPPQTLNTPGLSGSNGILSDNFQIISGYPSVIFRRDGTVSANLELYTTTKRGDPKDFRATRVLPATGRTEYFRFNGSAWGSAQ